MPNGKKIPRATIYAHFFSLPEAQRVRLLQTYMTPEAIDFIGSIEYGKTLGLLKKMPREQAMAWLDNPDKRGASMEALIKHGEELSGGFLHEIYVKFAPHNPTQADKLYALFMSATLSNRLPSFWEHVKGKPREEYKKKGLTSVNTVKKLALYMENPNTIARGKTLDGFLEEVAKTMDLSKVNSAVKEIAQKLDPADPNRKEKLRQAAQVLLVQLQGKSDLGALGEQLAGNHWETAVSPRTAMRREKDELPIDKLIARAKENIRDLAETPEDKLLFQEAALQNCREAKKLYRENDFAGANGKAFDRFTSELHEELAKHYLTQSRSKELCSSLAEEYRTLTKVKSGFMLSSTNTPEHKAMTKNLRLLNAKLALLQGQKIDDFKLDPEDAKAVREKGLNKLYDNARIACYNYGCLKTRNGKSGIIHTAGEARFDSNMRVLTQLHELGRSLRLAEPAALLRDEAQCQLLANRRNTRWLEENAVDYAARTIYAQTLLNEGKSWDQQKRLLSGEALLDKVEQIKNQPSFKRMVSSAGAKGLADAMIHGVSHLAELYGEAVRKMHPKGQQAETEEIDPRSLQANTDSIGLTPPQ